MRIPSFPTGRRLTLLALAALSALVLGSCDCDCDACNPETLSLSFDLDSLGGGFRRAEIRSAYVVRYPLNRYQQPLDTVRQNFNNGYLDFYATRALVPTYLFAARAGDGANTPYSYRIVVPAAARTYDVTDVELAYEQDKGCCACTRLTRRRFRLNGVYVDADASSAAGTVLRR